jgi:hypothetical protein
VRWRISRRSIALFASLAVHGALLSLLAVGTVGAVPDGFGPTGRARVFANGWLQLRGQGALRPAGRDALLDILSASDGVMIRLLARGGDAVGLASWSDSTGLWLAVDRLTPGSPRTLRVWARIGEEPRRVTGTLHADANGSGRVIGLWPSPQRSGGAVTLEVSDGTRMWPLSSGAVLLEGSSRD